jgi:hypothetical protein
MITATTEAQTDVAPLIPHNQGVKEGDLAAAALMPSGKAVPINTPIGKRIPVATAMRTAVTDPANLPMACGVRTPNAANAQSSRNRHPTAWLAQRSSRIL